MPSAGERARLDAGPGERLPRGRERGAPERFRVVLDPARLAERSAGTPPAPSRRARRPGRTRSRASRWCPGRRREHGRSSETSLPERERGRASQSPTRLANEAWKTLLLGRGRVQVLRGRRSRRSRLAASRWRACAVARECRPSQPWRTSIPRSFSSLSFGPSLPCTPDFSRRAMMASWSRARPSMACLRRRFAGDRLRDVLPPDLRQLAVIRHVDAGRRPELARRAAIELDPAADLRREIGHRLCQMSLSRMTCRKVTDFFSVTVFEVQNWA